MGAPAEMPHADEALKSLVSRFKEDPGSGAFTELAAALLARGHASEALRIAEHGLQIVPDSVDGRIERAAALLALGRPRVAFVELKRALAINPTNRKAARLLGKVYVDAGAPARAAELLKQRSSGHEEEEAETTHVTQAPVLPFGDGDGTGEMVSPANQVVPRGDTAPLPKRGSPPIPPVDRAGQPFQHGTQSSSPQPPPPRPSPPPAAPYTPSHKPGEGLPDLFSDLTRDLGLGNAPEGAPPISRVEVTQIIRRKKDRQPRSPSELAMIEGPIVDTTQPGQLSESTDVPLDTSAVLSSGEPPPLFDAVTSPRLQLAQLALDDEPLFQEHMPFAVRPVEGGSNEGPSAEPQDPMSDLRETIDEDAPPELDTAVRAALGGRNNSGSPPPNHGAHSSPQRYTEGGDTLVDGLEETSTTPDSVSVAPPLDLNARADDPSTDPVRFDGSARPLLELSRPSRRLAGAPKLEIIEPKASTRDVIWAAVGTAAMVIFLVLFLALAPRPWRLSVFSGDEPSSGMGSDRAAGSSGASPLAKDGPGTRAK